MWRFTSLATGLLVACTLWLLACPGPAFCDEKRVGAPPPPAVGALQFGFQSGPDGWAAGSDTVLLCPVPANGAGRRAGVAEVIMDGTSATIRLQRQLDLSSFQALQAKVFMPRTRAHTHWAAYIVDEEDFWYQTWRPVEVRTERWDMVEFDLRPEAGELEPVGHSRPWGPYVARRVKEVGIRVFADREIRATILLDNISLVPRTGQPPEQTIYNFETSGGTVGRFKKFEITFELSRTYDNPYDPAQVEVLAHFTDPSGKVTTVTGFFYQDFERRLDQKVERLIPVGPPKWKVRFAPRELGVYSYRIEVSDGQTLRTPPRQFTCVASDDPGFVRVCAEDPRYFEFENGAFFYPIGHNIPATFNVKAAGLLGITPERFEGTAAYDRFLAGMARARENYARIWLGAWSFGLEWSRRYDRAYQGLGRYNQQNAWRLDYVLNKAEELGIYVQLALTTFGHFRSDQFEGDWNYSPYNVVNGGPLHRAQEFWSHEPSQQLYQRMVRYVMSRWSYATHIAAWELCNEIDLVTAYEPNKPHIIAWHKRCADTIRRYDPNGHMITTNFANSGRDPDILKLPEISFSSTNHYCVQIVDFMRRNIFPAKSAFGKPAIMAECGDNFKGSSPESTERYVHIGLWGSYMIPFAGAGMPWWWDFLDDRNLYPMFRPLAEFAHGEDRRKRALETSDGALFDAAGASIPELAALTLQNDTSGYFWIYERGMLRGEADPNTVPDRREGIVLELRGLSDGAYRVEFWDTWKGGVIEQLTAEAINGTLRCPTPKFSNDVAGKFARHAQ